MPLPQHASSSKSSVCRQLPELPLLPEHVQKKVFTHKGKAGLPSNIEEDDEEAINNERLGHLGDAVLNLVVTSHLQKTFPRHRIGPLAKKRAEIVLQDHVAELAVSYRLPEKIDCHFGSVYNVRGSKGEQANVFKAYLGAVFNQYGYKATEAWLVKVLTDDTTAEKSTGLDIPAAESAHPAPIPPPISSATTTKPNSSASPLPPVRSPLRPPDPPVDQPPTYNTATSFSGGLGASSSSKKPIPNTSQPASSSIDSKKSESSAASPGSLMLFHELCTKNKTGTPTYDFTPEGPPNMRIWTAKVTVDKRIVGIGTAGSKQGAKDNAAREALKTLGWPIP